MTRADIHGTRTEQRLGRETLVSTQASLMEATGTSTLSDKSRHLLLLSVSTPFYYIPLGMFSGMSFSTLCSLILEFVLYFYNFCMICL